MSTIALTYQVVHRTITSVPLPIINWKALYGVMITLAVVLLVAYVYQINALTGGTYLIRNYNKQVTALIEEHKSLESKFAEADFLGTAMNQAYALNFQKITDVTYLQMVDNSVAKR